jgi:hypothetical protein
MSNCPDYLQGCRALGRQRDLTPSEQTRITGPAAALSDQAQMCSYCGLVYTKLSPTRRLGWLDGMIGLGFTAVAAAGQAQFVCA